jgi:hypothetical protein
LACIQLMTSFDVQLLTGLELLELDDTSDNNGITIDGVEGIELKLD